MSSFKIGVNSYAKTGQAAEPVIWDTDKLSNCHVGITGTSGSGKTYQIKRFASAFTDPDIRIDIFDYHGDIDVKNASAAMFSEQTKYGYNPFVVNLDPHYGGLRKSANAIIEIMGNSRKLGDQQAAVMRNLVMDCYELKRMYPEKPASWVKREATEDECERLYNARDWGGLAQCYPTLMDLERLIIRKLKLSMMGLDDNNTSKKSLFAFETFMRQAQRVKQAKMKNSKENTDEAQAALDKSREKTISEYTEAINAVETGNEFEDILKYSSVETLQSLLTRVKNVRALGLFNSNPPPFTGNIHRYLLKPMATSEHELKMFLFSRLTAIYREEMQKGESHGKVRRVIIVDEAKRFCDEDPANPINIIANEMRKFGIALILASQSPVHFPTDFINSAGTLLIQNMATGDYDMAARKLQIDKDKLQWLVPQKNGMVRLLLVQQKASWRTVNYQ